METTEKKGRLVHTFSFDVMFKTEEEMDALMKYMHEFQMKTQVLYFRHRTNCMSCNGSGEVGARGIYVDCQDCDGGARV